MQLLNKLYAVPFMYDGNTSYYLLLSCCIFDFILDITFIPISLLKKCKSCIGLFPTSIQRVGDMYVLLHA